jgi:hypothetical protein
MPVEFEWPCDENGYRLVAVDPRDDWSRVLDSIQKRATPRSHPTRERIVPAGGKLITRRPLDEAGGKLHRRFMRLGQTREGLLQFTRQYGPLTLHGNKAAVGEDVQLGLTQASLMNELFVGAGDKTALSVLLMVGGARRISDISVVLGVNPETGEPQLTLAPPDLCSALWLELAHSLTSDALLKRCQHCGELFEAGRGTGRREDAKFCSPYHQVAFNSLRRRKRRATNT